MVSGEEGKVGEGEGKRVVGILAGGAGVLEKQKCQERSSWQKLTPAPLQSCHSKLN